MIHCIVAFAERIFRRYHPVPAAAAAALPAPVAAPAVLPAPDSPGGRRGRPVSATLMKTIELLSRNSALTPAELSSKLGVAPSYARTLLRRARERAAEMTTPAAVVAVPAGQTVPAIPVDSIIQRLASVESQIRRLQPGAAQFSGRRWDLSRRAEVVRRGLAGEDSSEIAAALHIPQGEVRFILKVHRLIVKAH